MEPEEPGSRQPPLYSRLLWFVVLWLAGVVAVGALALLLRRMLL